MRYVLRELAETISLLEAADCDSALRHAADHPDIDLVLLDLNMPGIDGFALLDLFSSRYPALPVVILSASNEQNHMQRALNAGALGFIPKETTGTVMLNALRLVLSGGIYVPPSIALKQSPEMRGVKSDYLESQVFTPRQQETLKLLVQGYSNKEIARRMDLAEATVKMHITAIFKSLGVNNRTQAVLAAKKLDLGFSAD